MYSKEGAFVSYWMYTDNQRYNAYIKNMVTGKKIVLPVMPQGISESISANFTQQDIVGASVPRILYNSTSANQISFSLQNLTEDYLANPFETLEDYVRALKALVYPEYGSGGIVKSPDLIIVLGDRSIRCVCTSVNVSWGTAVRDQHIISCSVDLSLIVTRNDIPGSTIIELDKNA